MHRRYSTIAFMISIMAFASVSSYGKNTQEETLPDTITILGDKFYPPYEQLNEEGQPEGAGHEPRFRVRKGRVRRGRADRAGAVGGKTWNRF